MAINLPVAVVAFITALESVSGVPIAILERKDKTEDFWARTAAILCEKTGDNWCEQDVRFMNSNTELMGQSQIIEYKSEKGGVRRVCAIIPPIADIDPAFVAEAYGSPFPMADHERPTSTETASWLMLYHASHCLDATLSSNEESRAAAFATLGLSLLEGDMKFLPGQVGSSARRLAVMTRNEAAYWAAGTGERILMDLWKQETAYVLKQIAYHCNVTIVQNSSIDTEKIKRHTTIPQGKNCVSVTEPPTIAHGEVSDNNLYLWMFGPDIVNEHYEGERWPTVGYPPLPYTPAKSFPSMEDAAKYVLQTANHLAR